MSFKWIASAFVISGLAFACGGGSGGGGGSGVDTDVEIDTLDAAEAQDLCEYIIGLQEMPERTVDCGGGNTITIGINPGDVAAAVTECTAGLQSDVTDACAATVGDVETCFETIEGLSDAELCSETTPIPASCAFIQDENCG
jgi:hypothetical protein